VSTGLAALQFLQLSRSGGQDARRTAGETPALPGLFAGSFCRFDLYKQFLFNRLHIGIKV
jgi:hypothetical protein